MSLANLTVLAGRAVFCCHDVPGDKVLLFYNGAFVINQKKSRMRFPLIEFVQSQKPTSKDIENMACR